MVTTLFINFSDAQGQLTPKSLMESCRNSNSSELLWLVLLSARMKKIHPKMKVLEWSQHFSHYKYGDFPRRSRAANSKVPGRILLNFKPIRDFMVVLVSCKNKEEKIKMKELEWSQDFPHYNPMGAICCLGNQSSDLILSKT